MLFKPGKFAKVTLGRLAVGGVSQLWRLVYSKMNLPIRNTDIGAPFTVDSAGDTFVARRIIGTPSAVLRVRRSGCKAQITSAIVERIIVNMIGDFALDQWPAKYPFKNDLVQEDKALVRQSTLWIRIIAAGCTPAICRKIGINRINNRLKAFGQLNDDRIEKWQLDGIRSMLAHSWQFLLLTHAPGCLQHRRGLSFKVRTIIAQVCYNATIC